MSEERFKSISQVDENTKESTLRKENLQDKIKVIDKKISALSNTIERVHTVKMHRQIYLEYKKDLSYKAFFE